ncbi:MAG TPA: MarC family protein [Verrucomicrobiae bacterium]|nr:MarC family protein [Verrucomicrobiae bacterium]
MFPIVKSSILVVSALFPIVNPLGGAPIFLSLTHYYSTIQRKLLSRNIAVNCFLLLIGSFFIGTHILAFFGISLPVVQVGGGLVVVSAGWKMLNENEGDESRGDVQHSVDPRDLSTRAFYPLTLPLTVGPGSISVAITLGANEPHHGSSILFSIIGAVIGSLLIALSVYFCYAFADRLAQILGRTAMVVIMRLTSFLLVCIGVQIFWNGFSALLSSVPAAAR